MSSERISEQIKQYMQWADRVSINHFQTIDSTNRWLLENGQCHDVCIADQQTAGRGRRGKAWHSPDTGNIYLSIKYCFDQIHPHFSLLGLVMGVAVAEVLECIGLQEHKLKWPNDIYWQNAKLGGILLESQKTGEVIVGIGLNVTEDAVDVGQAKTSLHHALDGSPDYVLLVARLLDGLITKLMSFESIDLMAFHEEWSKWDYLANKMVDVYQKDQHIVGWVKGIDKAGCLLVQTDQGDLALSSADVSVRSKQI